MDQLADDGPKIENPEEQEQGSSQTRPYECTFCRRGFSNAQALGGHMNIHRKDKAKLRQSEKTNQQQQLLEKPMFFPSLSTKPDIGQLKPSAPSAGAPAGLVSDTKWPPWIVREKFPDAKMIRKGKEVQQLALFEEKPFGKEEEIRSLDQVMGDRHKVGPGACQSSMELDLELRLGPEPDYCSSTTPISTKKFF